ncbi:hypothetical protein [Salinicola rhizosphaerae]|uniref:Uncharacterized protein n=1 Tax=Salinicola rhizosphaerae TaxID=1443141 RepID=A0ABQ3EFP7_9GAMM|nr:hypothetical protein [Salinicola rhizosphaerae]GHB33142.1 hypothetical protein GCM10009038_35170 [Salinicola rhizosphaerae]
MADIEQLKARIREEVEASRQRQTEFTQQLIRQRDRLTTLLEQIIDWVDALDIDQLEITRRSLTQTVERFGEPHSITLSTLEISFGACKLHVKPEEQYLTGHRTLMYSTADEEDVKEILHAEENYYYADLQFGQKRHLSQYSPLIAENFYKLLFAWLRV